jgi:phage-related protein
MIVLLHAFQKKTDETPPEELTIVLRNKKDWEMRVHLISHLTLLRVA